MSGWATPERLLELLTASPQYAASVADRLADLARELLREADADADAVTASLGQVDLLWRIAGYLFRRRWETRAAAALALERVGLAVAPEALAQVLFGLSGGQEEDGTTEEPLAVAHEGLLSLAGLDVGRVLRDGEPLLASTGEEFSLEGARGSLSREELEAQKRAILRRLGLEVQDAEARQALEIGGGGLDGFGIQEADLAAQRNGSTGRGRQGTRKRKLGEMALEATDAAAADGGAAASSGKQEPVKKPAGRRGRKRAAALDKEGGEMEPKEEQRQPWLAEHLSVRLFDAGWESRHGAALGLTALFKAWRGRSKGQQNSGEWTRRWAEDVAGRCLCLLALDRFGDFSVGCAVAPIREVAGQLLGLVVLASGGGGGGGDPSSLLPHALIHLQTLAASAVEQEGEEGGEEDEDVRPWEVRHGAFVGLKYLVALPSEPVRAAAPALLRLACGGLHDATEDVREAAATTIHSLLLLLPPSAQDAGPAMEIDLAAILLPILRALGPPDAGSSGGAAAAAAVAASVAAALYLPSFLRLASSVLDRVLPPAPSTLLLPPSFWDTAPPAADLLTMLWGLGGSTEPSIRGPALGLLARVLRYWAVVGNGESDGQGGRCGRGGGKKKGGGGGTDGVGEARSRVQKRAEALGWEVLKALRAGHTSASAPAKGPSPELLRELQAVWTALVAALGLTRAAALAPRVADDWLSSSTGAASALFPEEGDWGARRRTAAALAALAPEMVAEKAQAALGSGELAARECAALLLGQCLAGSDGGSGAVAALQAVMEEGVAALPQNDEAHRRLAVAAGAALVAAGAASESPGTAIRALMEAVKGEGDKERQAMAIDALVRLVAALLAAEKGRKAMEKVVGNLCVLACAMQQDDPALAVARGGAREALKGLVARLGPGALESLPVLWPRIAGGVAGGSTAAEEAVRLLMVITPAVAEEGPAVASVRSLVGPLVGLVTAAEADAVGNGDEGGSSRTRLVGLLASRCLAILLKRGQVGVLAARMGPLLHRALRDRHHETARQRAAHCLLELAKAVRALPATLEPEAHAALPALLLPALATVADDDPEVRTPGAEAFRLLVELAPLLHPQEWVRQHDDGAPPLDAAEARARESVMLLVLGGGGKGAAAGAVTDAPAAAASFAWPAALPGLLRGGLVLRPYQWEGVRWLTLLRRSGLHGALCDDMGLGKTLQALVALAVARCEAEEDGQGDDGGGGLPSLVLCPASISGHWAHEARRFLAPQAVEPLLYRAGLTRREKEAILRGASGRSLVVASYDLLRRDVALFASRPWAFLLLDEAHVLRGGQGTALGRAVRRLRAGHRVALTGTPLQNQVQDVWAIYDLLMPGLLGDKRAFEREYGRPIGRATLRSATADATAEALSRLDRLHAHLLPFLLRRRKGKVLRDLPPKTVTDLACDLVPLQREMYEGHCATAPAQEVLSGLAALVADEAKGALAGGRKGVREQLGVRALRLLHYLRLLCVHPALVLEADSPAREQLLGEADCSGKMVALQQLLFACGVFEECREPAPDDEGEEEEEGGVEEAEAEQEGVDGDEEEEEEEASRGEAEGEQQEEEEEGEEGGEPKSEPAPPPPPAAAASRPEQPVASAEGLHRCLVFAQHRVTLDAIERALLRGAKWNPAYAALTPDSSSKSPRYLRLDGSVPSGQRVALVQRFNGDASVALMLLTTRVGGLGLNLTGADVVIFVEHDWNPAVDLQAMDRAHRIGQGRPVNVYRLVTQGSVEEQVLALQRRKQEMAEAVVQQPGNAGRFEDRGMASVLDLVAASVGKGAQQQQQEGAFGGGGGGGSSAAAALALPDAEGGGGGLPLPSEEPWDEGQYSGFAVQAFLTNVLGVGDGGGGGGDQGPRK